MIKIAFDQFWNNFYIDLLFSIIFFVVIKKIFVVRINGLEVEAKDDILFSLLFTLIYVMKKI